MDDQDTRKAKERGTGSAALDIAEVTRFLTAIGDPVRLQILFLLGEKGEINMGDVAEHFHLSRPAISYHLKVLKEAGVLDNKKVGQEMFYRLQCDLIAARLAALAEAAASFKCEE